MSYKTTLNTFYISLQAGSSVSAKKDFVSAAHAKLKKTLNKINPLKTTDIVKTAEPKSKGAFTCFIKGSASASGTADLTGPATASEVTAVLSPSAIEV